MLKLPLPDSSTEIPLSNLIKCYSEREENVEKKCENCCTHAANCPQSGACKSHLVVRQTKLTRIGKFLIIQLKRYSQGNKNKTKVLPEEVLELNNQKYTLSSVIEHSGRPINAGHSPCIVRDKIHLDIAMTLFPKKWIHPKYSEEIVTRICLSTRKFL